MSVLSLICNVCSPLLRLFRLLLRCELFRELFDESPSAPSLTGGDAVHSWFVYDEFIEKCGAVKLITDEYGNITPRWSEHLLCNVPPLTTLQSVTISTNLSWIPTIVPCVPNGIPSSDLNDATRVATRNEFFGDGDHGIFGFAIYTSSIDTLFHQLILSGN